MAQNRIRKAVFPVAGLGTRFLPATKSIPKEMLPLIDRPLIQYAIDEARAAGIEQFIFVTSRGKSALEDYFDEAPYLEGELARAGKTDLLQSLAATKMESGALAYVRQNRALGLGHAVWCARRLIGDEPFAVILPDDVIAARTPCLRQMVEAYAEVGGNLVAMMEVSPLQASAYGILELAPGQGALRRVTGMVEKPAPGAAPSNLAIVGRYILSPHVLARIESAAPGAGGEIQLTDAIAGEIGRRPVHGLAFEGRRFDCGSKAGLLQATVALAFARPDLHQSLREIVGELFAPPGSERSDVEVVSPRERRAHAL